MPTILFYSPFNQRSRDTESVMLAFHKQGNRVLSLTQQEGRLINDFLNANGIRAYAHILPGLRSGWWYYFRHLIFFIRFCRKERVDIVYSHLEPANLVASIGQYFIKADTYLCRHHINEGLLYQFDGDFSYRITYWLAKKIIVVSDHAKRYMIEKENIPEKKILHINLAYDFALYGKPNEEMIKNIRNQYGAEVLLLSACRLTTYKHPEAGIHLVKKLSDLGMDVKLVILGQGEMREQLEALKLALGLQNKVFMPGYVENVVEFMGAADFFIHPSLLDSSCVAVKEAGLAKRPVIVNRGVGDFEDYIVDGYNGFLVDQTKFIEAASEIINRNLKNKDFLSAMGENLKNSVLERFSIEKVINEYHSLNYPG